MVAPHSNGFKSNLKRDTLNLLLELVYKHKPYQCFCTARPSKWQTISNEYNDLTGSKIRYNELRDKFDKVFQAFTYNYDLADDNVNLKTLQLIATEHKSSEQQKDNDEISLLLRLMDKYKPHVNRFGKVTIKWEAVLESYNCISNKSLSKPISLISRFSRVTKAYNKKNNLFYLECDNPPLLEKLVEENNNVCLYFPEGWLACLLSLINKYNPYAGGKQDQALLWRQILQDYNAILHSKIDDASILQFNFKEAVKAYQENREEFMINHNISQLSTILDMHYKSEIHSDDSIDILLELINKHKPFKKPKDLGLRRKAWKLVLERYNLLASINYLDYRPLQKKFKAVVKNYLDANSLTDCSNKELLQKLTTEYVLENPRSCSHIIRNSQLHSEESVATYSTLEKKFNFDRAALEYQKDGATSSTLKNVSSKHLDEDLNKYFILKRQDINRKLAKTSSSSHTIAQTSLDQVKKLVFDEKISLAVSTKVIPLSDVRKSNGSGLTEYSKGKIKGKYLDLLLQLVYNSKPYEYPPTGRPSAWKGIANEFNSLSTSNMAYNELRDNFDLVFAAFNHNKDALPSDIDTKTLLKISKEYKNSNQQTDDDDTSLLLKLMDTYKPHLNQFGTDTHK